MIAHKEEWHCFKPEGRSPQQLFSSVTLHHSLPPCSCSLERGGGSVFSTWRGRETHPSTPSRCTETSRGTGGHSLQSFNMQDSSARQVTLPLGPCCSGKHRRQQLLSQQGCRERPLQRHRDSQPTAVTANAGHAICRSGDLEQVGQTASRGEAVRYLACPKAGSSNPYQPFQPKPDKPGLPPAGRSSLADKWSKLGGAEKKTSLVITRSLPGHLLQSPSPKAQRAFPHLSHLYLCKEAAMALASRFQVKISCYSNASMTRNLTPKTKFSACRSLTLPVCSSNAPHPFHRNTGSWKWAEATVWGCI